MKTLRRMNETKEGTMAEICEIFRKKNPKNK